MHSTPHICNNNNCSLYHSHAVFPSYIECPVCKEPLVPKDVLILNELEQKIIDEYPYVIAHTFFKMHNEGTTAQSRAYLFKDVINGTLKHLALLVATEYFESSIKNEAINKLFDENLRHHTLGQLHEFIRNSLKELKNEDHTFFMPELPVFYDKVQTSRKKTYKISTAVTDEIGELIINTKKETAIDSLIYFRNREIGHGLTWTEEQYQQIYNFYYPILLDLLVAMSFVKNYSMFKWDKGYKWNLMGAKISKAKQQIISRNQAEHIWMENVEEKKLDLLPFFITPKSHITGTPGHVELFIYEDYTGNKIYYLSPENERGTTSGRIVEVLSSKLQNKLKKHLYNEASLTKELLTEKVNSFNKEIRMGLEKEGKIHRNIYQPRNEAENSLHSWIDTRFCLFFIQATAGSGKTNLLAEIEKQYNKEKTTSLLIRASRIDKASISEALEEILDLQKDFDFYKFKDLGFRPDNPFILLIDGGNEHNTPVTFLIDIFNFISKYSGGYIKVVLTWRAESTAELPPISDSYRSLIYSDKELIDDTNVLASKNHHLSPLNNNELEEAWKRYAKGQNRKYKVEFSLEDLTYYDRSFLELLKKPFNLNLFLKLFDNKRSLPKKEKRYNLWEDYWNKISKNRIEYHLLNCLIEIMFYQRLHNVSSAVLYEDKVFREFLYDNDIKGPYQQLILKEILVEYYLNGERYLTFSSEGVYHFILGKFLRENIELNTYKNITNLLEENKMKGISEAIQQMLDEDVKRGDISRLLLFLNNENQYYEIFIPPLTVAISLQRISNSINKDSNIELDMLKVVFSKNDLEGSMLIKKILEYCKELQRFDLVEFIYQKLHFQGKILSNTQLELTINSISYLEKNEKYKTIEFLKNYENKFGFGNDFNLMNNFGNVLLNIGEYATSLEYLEKALKTHEIYSISYFSSLNDKGLDLLYLERLQEAADLYENALEIITTNHEIEYNEDIHMSLYQNFALSLKKLKKNDRALSIYFKVIELIIEKYGSQHSLTAQVFNNIATNFRALEEYDKALEHHQKALKIRINLFGEDDPETAMSYHNMAYLFQIMGQIEKAIDFYSKAFHINKSKYQPNHLMFYAHYKMVGDLWMKEGKFNNAIIPLKKAWEISSILFGSNNIKTSECSEDFLEAAFNLEEINLKIENLEWWWKNISEKKGGPAYQLFLCYQHQEQPINALEWLEQTYIIRKERLGIEDELTLQTLQELKSFAKKTSQLDMIKKYPERIM